MAASSTADRAIAMSMHECETNARMARGTQTIVTRTTRYLRYMVWGVLAVLVLVLIGAGFYMSKKSKEREAQKLADAREEAQRCTSVSVAGDEPGPSDDAAVKQALVDAGERYTAAGSQLERAKTRRQFDLARDTALEGLYYTRAARLTMGLDEGPQLPPMPGQVDAGRITESARSTSRRDHAG